MTTVTEFVFNKYLMKSCLQNFLFFLRFIDKSEVLEKKVSKLASNNQLSFNSKKVVRILTKVNCTN